VLRQAQQDPDVAEAAVDYTDGYARVALTLLDEASAAWRGLLADLSRGQAVVLAAVKPDEGDAAR
jgi:hypothetical protein